MHRLGYPYDRQAGGRDLSNQMPPFYQRQGIPPPKSYVLWKALGPLPGCKSPAAVVVAAVGRCFVEVVGEIKSAPRVVVCLRYYCGGAEGAGDIISAPRVVVCLRYYLWRCRCGWRNQISPQGCCCLLAGTQKKRVFSTTFVCLSRFTPWFLWWSRAWWFLVWMRIMSQKQGRAFRQEDLPAAAGKYLREVFVVSIYWCSDPLRTAIVLCIFRSSCLRNSDSRRVDDEAFTALV